MTRKLSFLFFAIFLMNFTGCIHIDEEPPLERGYVECGQETCQPGMHCSAPDLSFCSRGCLSNANCLQEEQCVRERSHDTKGTCIPTKTPPCCQ